MKILRLCLFLSFFSTIYSYDLDDVKIKLKIEESTYEYDYGPMIVEFNNHTNKLYVICSNFMKNMELGQTCKKAGNYYSRGFYRYIEPLNKNISCYNNTNVDVDENMEEIAIIYFKCMKFSSNSKDFIKNFLFYKLYIFFKLFLQILWIIINIYQFCYIKILYIKYLF